MVESGEQVQQLVVENEVFGLVQLVSSESRGKGYLFSRSSAVPMSGRVLC